MTDKERRRMAQSSRSISRWIAPSGPPLLERAGRQQALADVTLFETAMQDIDRRITETRTRLYMLERELHETGAALQWLQQERQAILNEAEAQAKKTVGGQEWVNRK
jgi:hypothetical protein